MELALSIERSGGRLNVYASGELDMASAPKLVQAVEEEFENRMFECILDFRGVTFMDSEAIKDVIALRRKLLERGIRLAIVNTRGPVTRILSIVDPLGNLTGWEGIPQDFS